MELKQATLVILASANGRDGWCPVKPENVPAWAKEPDCIARLVAGHMCMKCDEGPDGSQWYRAATEDELRALACAQERNIEQHATVTL